MAKMTLGMVLRTRGRDTDAPALQTSLLAHLNGIADKEDAAFAAVVLSSLKRDGVALETAALKQGLASATYRSLFDAVLDDASGAVYGLQGNGGFVIDTGLGLVRLGTAGRTTHSRRVGRILKSRRWWDGTELLIGVEWSANSQIFSTSERWGA